MKKFILALSLTVGLSISSFGAPPILQKVLTISGAPSDAVVHNGKIYFATEMGKVDIVDSKRMRKVKSIVFPKFEDFMGGLQAPKVFSVDVSPDGKTVIAVVQGNRGGRELYTYRGGKLYKIFSWRDNIQAYRVRFVDNNRVILGLSGDEIILYDLKGRKIIYRKYVGMSYFSDMEINSKRDKIALTDESGDTRIIDVKTGKIVKIIEELNKDKAFDIDFKNDRILNGSRDKRAVYYNLKTNKYKIYRSNDFMVFSVGLSPTGKRGAYLYNSKYDVRVVETESGSYITTLRGHLATPSIIKFVNESSVVTGCDDGKVFFWKIKK